jgi:hypothetical protein
MKRMAIAAAWVWIALAQPASARAPAPSELVAGAALRGVMPAMCSDTVANFVRAARSGNLADVAPLPVDESDGPVPWCLTPDDPRCAPRDASSLPDPSRAPVPVNRYWCRMRRRSERRARVAGAASSARRAVTDTAATRSRALFV